MHKSKKQRVKEKHILMVARETNKELIGIYNCKHIIIGHEHVVFMQHPKLRARNIHKCKYLRRVKERIPCEAETTIKDYTEFHELREGRIIKTMKGEI